MTRKKLIELLKSGDFTVASHNYGQVSIYQGKIGGYNCDWSKHDDMPDFPKKNKEVARFDMSEGDGYMQAVVALFTEALGGANGGSA